MANVAKILLSGLRRRGFVLTFGPDCRTLLLEPFSKLTDADRTALKQHKEAVLDLLWHEETAAGDRALGWPDDPRPAREEWWDEETEEWRTVQPERTIVCLNLLPSGPPETPEPAADVPVVPPPGAVLHYQDRRGRRCHADGTLYGLVDANGRPIRKASAVFRWCWESGPMWFHAAIHAPP